MVPGSKSSGQFTKWGRPGGAHGSWEKALRAQVTPKLPGNQELMAGRLTLWATGVDRKCPGQVASDSVIDS